MNVHRPTTLSELSQAIASSTQLKIGGLEEENPSPGDSIDWLLMSEYSGIVQWMPEDQVVVARAGTLLSTLQSELAVKGQCLPLPQGIAEVTLGGAISLNLPHAFQDQYGSWRDWVLGMTVVLADGSVRKCGSHAVKNVAGYDVQKLFIGARGTLGVIAEVILRTYPLKLLPVSSAGFGVMPSEITDPVMIKYMKRAKQIFDPTHKLNPGEMGIF